MHLSSGKLAFLGLLLAISEVLIILSGILEFNTLFLLAAAAFCVGIAFRESDMRYAFGFYLASVILGVILAPNKLYCITFAALGGYILISEFVFDKLIHIKELKTRRRLLWIIKYAAFNVMYIPALVFLPKLFYAGSINTKILIALLIGGQAALYIYDVAYSYFQRFIWGKVRGKLKLK
jgi:hypothetical protein